MNEIIGTIGVCKGCRSHNMFLWSESEFFKDPIVWSIDGDYIVFRHATIDDRKGVLNPYFNKKKKRYTFTINIEKLRLGMYNFDEDSNEDEIVIKYL